MPTAAQWDGLTGSVARTKAVVPIGPVRVRRVR